MGIVSFAEHRVRQLNADMEESRKQLAAALDVVGGHILDMMADDELGKLSPDRQAQLGAMKAMVRAGNAMLSANDAEYEAAHADFEVAAAKVGVQRASMDEMWDAFPWKTWKPTDHGEA